MKASEVNAWFGDQSGESGHEVKWLEEYVRGAIAPGRFEGVADLAVRGQ